jgi:hypothetical protein
VCLVYHLTLSTSALDTRRGTEAARIVRWDVAPERVGVTKLCHNGEHGGDDGLRALALVSIGNPNGATTAVCRRCHPGCFTYHTGLSAPTCVASIPNWRPRRPVNSNC